MRPQFGSRPCTAVFVSGLVAVVGPTIAAASSPGAPRTSTVTRRVAPSPSAAITRQSSWLTSVSARVKSSLGTGLVLGVASVLFDAAMAVAEDALRALAFDAVGAG